MKVADECFSCLLSQGERAIALAGVKGRNKEVMTSKVGEFLKENFREDRIPAQLGTELQCLVFELTAVKDPLKEKKRRANDVAMSLSDTAERTVARAEDRLRQAVKIALAGNLIDFAVYAAEVDARILEDALQDPLIIDDCDALAELLHASKTVLYICDNAGEIVFDKILIDELIRMGLEVTACVKSAPIVNDATMEDADYVGLTDICAVITIGAATIGTTLSMCSKGFLRRLENSDLVISKGQANFETLHKIKNKKIAFLLKAKCPVIAEYMGVGKNSSIVKVEA